MKKHFVLLFIILLCLAIPCVAFAHPGRTDGDGGHTDHSTGEYHYHHGYPAHQHYDMDGDGRKDCPYEFDDRTGENSGPSSTDGSAASNSGIENHSPSKETKLGIILLCAYCGSSMVMLVYQLIDTIRYYNKLSFGDFVECLFTALFSGIYLIPVAIIGYAIFKAIFKWLS